MSTLGENLRKFREKFNFKQTYIADQINLSPKTYSSYERGNKYPNLDTLIILAKLFNTTPTNLLGFKTPDDIGDKDIETILMDDDINLTIDGHSIPKNDRQIILNILRAYYKTQKN